jgi:hypothetical protein
VTAGANFGLDVGGAEFRSLQFNAGAANWLKLNFNGDLTIGATPGTGTATASTIALGLNGFADADLTGTITGFGIYRDNTGANARFDTFQIDAVPEPSSLVLFAFGSVPLAMRRRARSARSDRHSS